MPVKSTASAYELGHLDLAWCFLELDGILVGLGLLHAIVL